MGRRYAGLTTASAGLFTALSTLCGACGSSQAERVEATRPQPAQAEATPSSAPSATPTAAPAPDPRGLTETIVTVTDLATLSRLEAAGLSFESRLAALSSKEAPPGKGSAATLAPSWQAVVSEIRRELRSVANSDPAAGVSVARFSHRLFDERWLTSQDARFELIGVTNRVDRAPFQPNHCGETRLVYRLAYEQTVRGERVRSKLPMTLVLEYVGTPRDEKLPPEVACRAAADGWRVAKNAAQGAPLADALLRGPLATPLLGRASLHQLGVNVQAVRWPSTVRPDLAGHAEYLLLGFEWSDEAKTLVPRPLENTPDVARLRADPKLRAELASWTAHNLAAIDAGTAQVPERFLAKRARSVTPRGFARLENRPFRSIFRASDFDAALFTSAEAEKLERVRSAEGLIRRLDDASCQGCHESRSVAGFHLLGSDVGSQEAGNALVTAFSAHVEDELERRRAVTDALAEGKSADFSRPSAERGAFDGYGAHCGLGDPSFATWTCAAGLTCQPYDAPKSERGLVGTCLPPQLSVGDPCEVGSVEPSLDARRDRVGQATRKECGGALACNSNEVGFPGGMCSASCSDARGDVRCGAIAILAPFNACLGRGEPFPHCLAEHVRPAGLRACGVGAPCRDDYICAQANTARPNEGVCLPPYFLFQLRVDGH